jgi:ankyrin repeat protein
LNQFDSGGITQIHHATKNGDIDRVAYLVSQGARLDIPDADGNQPLHLAIIGNRPDIITVLCRSGADLNAKGSDGKTPLHYALCVPQALETLLSYHPDLSVPDINGDTALHTALSEDLGRIGKRRVDIAEKLLFRGAGPNVPNHAGVTPFHMAINLMSSQSGQEPYVSLFSEYDVDLLSTMQDGSPPFQVFLNKVWSFQSGQHHHYENIIKFLDKGADPNTVVKRGRLEREEERLLYMMRPPNLSSRDEKRTIHRFHQLYMRLCESADIHIPSSRGDLPLHEVVRNYSTNWDRCIEVISALLQRGADPNQLNGKGNCPLQILVKSHCISHNVKPILKFLLKNNLDPMPAKYTGELPVYILFQRDSWWAVLLLIDAYVKRPESSSDSDEHPQQNLVWWRRYRKFCLQKHWSDEATELIEAAALAMPESVAQRLPKMLLTSVAVELLEDAKKNLLDAKERFGLSDPCAQSESSHIVQILRDCRKLGLDVASSWYPFLLELFD